MWLALHEVDDGTGGQRPLPLGGEVAVMQLLFFVLTFAGLLLPYLAPRNDRRLGRRIFWVGFLIATTSAFLVGYPPNWKLGLLLSLVFGGVMVFRAFMSTPYLKFRGTIYAYSARDSQPDPPDTGKRAGT